MTNLKNKCLAAILAVFLCFYDAGANAPTLTAATIHGPALIEVNRHVQANRSSFFVYENSDSGLNKGFFSGSFGATSKIHVNTACLYDPQSSNGCATDTTRMDQVRGTVVQISFDPLASGEFAGVNVEEPQNWGVTQTGVGYDLRGATQVCFDALSPSSNFNVQFGVGGHNTAFMTLSNQWTNICLDLSTLGLSSSDLANEHILFAVATNNPNAPNGGTVLLDNIRFDPAPDSQKSALSFPLSNTVFGIIPVPDFLSGRVPVPPDQILANLATTYESSVALMALLSRGNAEDAASARLIADAFVYALSHDNQGLPIPPAPDGSTGLHSGVMSGDLPLHNDQGAGQGKQGQVRLSGFSIGPTSTTCGTGHFCLVLDGATGGNVAFAMMALEAAYQRFNDIRYLNAARDMGNWIFGNLQDTTGTGFGGYYLGYPDMGQAKILIKSKSVENNADIYQAMATLSRITAQLGLASESQQWSQRAQIAGDFVIAMFDGVAGRFNAGTVPVGTPPSPGIQPNGTQKGNDVINTADFLDAQTFTTLALAPSSLYQNAINWRRPVQWILAHEALSVTAAGKTYQGFSLVLPPTAGPNGVDWEFTAQAVVTMRLVDSIYGEQSFETQAQSYLAQIQQAQQSAPFGDGQSVVAATMQDGDLLPPYQQCHSTPFQCIAERVGLAATTWAIFADLNVNPFVPPAFQAATPTISVWRPGTGTWYIVENADFNHPLTRVWGESGDVPVLGDYDGDGITDYAIWRPSTGTWWILPSTNPGIAMTRTWGVSGDIPVPGDYDGDGITDFAVWRPSTGTWWIIPSSNPGSIITRTWGVSGDIPVPGDYDGDGKTDLAVWRPSTGTWWIVPSSNPGTPTSQAWGVSGDTPVPADYDGDGKTDLAIWRPSTGVWWILPSTTPGVSTTQTWGVSGDIPVPGDYDGDGKADFVIWRPTTGTWWIIPTTNPGSSFVQTWGVNGDIPLSIPVKSPIEP